MESRNRSRSCRDLLWALALLTSVSYRYACKSVATSVHDFFLSLVNLVSVLFARIRRDEPATVGDGTPSRRVVFAAPVFLTVICLVLAAFAAWAQIGAPPRGQRINGSQLAAPRPMPVNRRPAIASTPSPAENTPSPAQDPVLYENGPVNGFVAAWPINGGVIVSDTFTLLGSANVQGFDIWVWESPGDQVSTLEWSITSAENGGTTFGSGTASVLDTFLTFNQFGFDIDELTVSGLNVPLQAGTFWLNVQNASVPSGKTVFWDENSGVNCGSPGCPSQASENLVGTIPSETFDISGHSNRRHQHDAVGDSAFASGGRPGCHAHRYGQQWRPGHRRHCDFLEWNAGTGYGPACAEWSSLGTATLRTRFAPGTYTLTARFNGTNFNAPSQSQPQPYTVTGTEPTITTLTAPPDGSNYDFTDSVSVRSASGSAHVNTFASCDYACGAPADRVAALTCAGASPFAHQRLQRRRNSGLGWCFKWRHLGQTVQVLEAPGNCLRGFQWRWQTRFSGCLYSAAESGG